MAGNLERRTTQPDEIILSETFRERDRAPDLIDLVQGLAMTAIGLSLFFAVTVTGFYALEALGFRDHIALLWSSLGALALIIDVILVLGYSAYQSVRLDRDGLVFQRRFGPSKRIPWDDLIKVAAAPRWEVFRRAWLWPGFPRRSSIFCGTTREVLHIVWHGGEYYFRPGDAEGFLALVRVHRPDVIGPAESSAR